MGKKTPPIDFLEIAFRMTTVTGTYTCLAGLPLAYAAGQREKLLDDIVEHWKASVQNVRAFAGKPMPKDESRITQPVIAAQGMLGRLEAHRDKLPAKWQPYLPLVSQVLVGRLEAFAKGESFSPNAVLVQCAFDAAALISLSLFLNWDEDRAISHGIAVETLLSNSSTGSPLTRELVARLSDCLRQARSAAGSSARAAELEALDAFYESSERSLKACLECTTR